MQKKKKQGTPIKEALMKEESIERLKSTKDYTQMKGELCHRIPGGIMVRCVEHKEAQKRLEEAHSRDLWILQRDQFVRQTTESGLLLA